MKILNSVVTIYNQIYAEGLILQKEVDALVHKFKNPKWHYFSRVKDIDSFALKLETGRIKDPLKLEDFFAATLVVQNLSDLRLALLDIEKEFEIVYRRPKVDGITHKESSDFPFDDLRLYLRIKSPEYLPPSALNELIFELQVKTFLQHAWSISTHDLIYKSDNINWAKERVAFQIRAMLEQAEIAISGAENLSLLPELAKQNKKAIELNKIKTFLTDNFSEDKLPKDLIRLSQIISDLLLNFKLSLDDLTKLLDKETTQGRGTNTLNLSPYSILIETIKNQDKGKFENAFKSKHRLKTNFIFIPKEILLDGIKIEDSARIMTT